VNDVRAAAVSAVTWSKVRGRAARRNAFNFANVIAIGMKSGLQGGRNRIRASGFADYFFLGDIPVVTRTPPVLKKGQNVLMVGWIFAFSSKMP
jgi:hypothetical protein